MDQLTVDVLSLARRECDAGRFTPADFLRREVERLHPNLSEPEELRQAIARKLGLVDDGRTWAQPGMAADRGEPRYLFIRAWGAGFWSDMTQVMAAALVAEITGRIPVVFWGSNSMFFGQTENAFDLYWRPLSDATIEDVRLAARDGVFPPRWTPETLTAENDSEDKWYGPWSRLGGLDYLTRPERVVVCDFYVGVGDMTPWMPSGHPMAGRSPLEVCRYLCERYLRPCAEVTEAVEKFCTRMRIGEETLAVHMRGSDKLLEVFDLVEANTRYASILDAEAPDQRMFVMTEDNRRLGELKHRYGSRVVNTQCWRSSGDPGPHFIYPGSDRTVLAREVMIDVFVALRCGRFLGMGASNVVAMIEGLKRWPEGSLNILGDTWAFRPNMYLYNIGVSGAVTGFSPPPRA